MNDFRDRISTLSPQRLALLALELHERLEGVDSDRAQPIAIVGIGCRFPGADGPQAFWDLLREGRDAITEVPPERWNVDDFYDPNPDTPGKMSTRYGGFLRDVDLFDPELFGISPREALTMDPQQRLLLEVAWEALEHAGLSPDGLYGSRTGVFVGMSSTDFAANMMRSGQPDLLDVHFSTGNARSVASGRLSYVLGWHGPSISVDTACSSSLVAIHLACQSLRSRECELALAGGVNLILSPDITIGLSKARMMAPDGRCKAFDARADGFVRAEGCGLVVLQRLGDALAAGANVIAVIRGSATNQDGRSSGITAPNGPAQEDAMRRALESCGDIDPGELAYVEAHGTGTSLGDPIEVGALNAVYGAAHDAERRLAIGSVKTNIGHLESAAGVAGLIKVALAVQHGEIPGNLHLTQLNPHIEWEETRFYVPTLRTSWPAPYRTRLAAVSSFGFSGTNAHVVLEGAPPGPRRVEETATIDRPVHLLPLSARTEAALRELCGRNAGSGCLDGEDFADVCYTASVGRAALAERMAIVTASAEEARSTLQSVSGGALPAGVRRGRAPTGGPPEVAFLFTGQGAQYAGMGRGLYETEPVFRAGVDACDAALRPHLERPLLSVMYPQPGKDALIHETAYTQPALFALEYGLAQLWRSWGIEPAAALGHSIGEYVAACVAGVLSLEEALTLVAARARLMQSLPTCGAMMAVTADEESVAELLGSVGGEVSIAASNGPRSVVISGAVEAVEAVAGRLEAQGVHTRRLTVSHAFHSALMEPMLDEFERIARGVSFAAPDIAVVANVTGKVATGRDLRDARYWREHVRGTVRFADGVRSMYERGCRVFVELGPKPTLLGMAKDCVTDSEVLWLPSLREGRDDSRQILDSLAALYVAGAPVDWAAFHDARPRRRVVLPTYPFQRECYWPEAASVQSARATSARVVDETAEWLYEVAWQGAQQHTAAAGSSAELRPIEGVLRSRGADLAAQGGVAAYAALVEGIDELCCRFILDALRELGWNPVPGRSITVSSLIDELGIVATHGRLVAQLLRILAEDGLLRGSGDEWQVREEVSRPAAGTLAAELRDRFPANEAELELLCRCGEALADVLRGGDALQVLFPDGSLETTEKLYRDSPVARVFNTLVAEGIEAVIGKIHDDRTVRILEIGGGTGGTTSHVLPRLDPDRTEYCFTDVSRLFTARAEEKFAAHPFVRYELLDIERDPAEQGIPEGGFDIVLAANVLHATRDLRATLQRVKRTLAPGGLLVLLEGISPQRFSDLTVGLTEGWWAYEDTDLRPTYALIDRSRWQELLAEEGFHDVVMAPGEREAGEAWGQQVVILSRAPHDQRGAVAEEGVARSWLVLADRGGIGGELTAMLRARGDSAVVARAGASFADHGEGRYTVDAADRRDFERLFGEAIAGELDGMVYLWALDVPPAEADAEAGAVASQEVACSGALHLIQAAAAATGHGSPRLWLVTRGAQPADDGSRRVAVEQSPLLGMGKVIALEHPELRCQRVDLDPAADSDAVALLSELDARTDDDQVALRDGVRKVARLVHIDAEHLDPPATAEIFRDDATYLITGAFGGLGLPLAEWMRASGARHLVLTGRREPGDDAARAIAALRQRGVKLLVARADVSRRADLQHVLEQIDDAMPPLRGVFHLAGALDDGVLLQQSWERFAKVMASKVEGSWNLHRMTRDAQLDYFVLFSSGASLIGSPGQGNHAAANAYLDALAFDRRAQGLPGLSVAWGAWADIGAAVQHQLSASTAFRLMAPAAALRCLGRLLQSDRVLVGVADVNWNELARRSLSSIPFLRVVMDSRAPAQKGAGQAPRASLRDELQAAIPARRRDLLQDRIAREAAQVLGIDPARPIDPERPLQELGLDSLMAVELRNALGQAVEHELPATLLFDHPTLASLFDFVATGVLDGLQAEAEDDESEEDPLTEDELEALLASKLASLQGESGR